MTGDRDTRRSADRRRDRAPLLPVPPSESIPPVDARGFGASIALALTAARRSRRPVSLVLVDLEVDAPVAQIVTALRTTIRETDGVWRPGPERLAVLLADAGGPESEPAFARLTAALAAIETPIRIGHAAAAPGIDAQSLLAIAEGDIRALETER